MSGVLILMYHQLFTESAVDRYSVPASEFERQMNELKSAGFRSLFPAHLDQDDDAGRKVMITFDDGYLSDFTLARPVLEKTGLNAVSFITTSYIGKPGYMTWEQVRELGRSGTFSVQSHTHTHPFLEFLTEAQVRDELLRSKRLIESQCGCSVTALSFPGGSFSSGVARLAQDAGYRYLFSSMPGITRLPVAAGMACRRIRVGRKTGMEGFLRAADGKTSCYWLSAAGYALRNGVKRLIGRRAYHFIWKAVKKRPAEVTR
ncbi:MAG: polysaccharide deacetylase family protein [Deltaproteobacteria bacterium]